MKFHYDCTKGKREIIGMPEDVIQVDHKRVGFINRKEMKMETTSLILAFWRPTVKLRMVVTRKPF